MATIKEIAEKSGVSIGTVDRVLHNRGRVSEDTRKRVLAVAKELDYVPNRVAQSLAVRKKKLNLACIILSSNAHPFFADVNAGAQRKAMELEEYGVNVTFIPISIFSEDGEAPLAGFGVPEGIDWDSFDGIAAPGEPWIVPEHIHVPIVCYNIPSESHPDWGYVGCDYFRAGEVAAGLCAMFGSDESKIAIFTEGDEQYQSRSFSLRVKGFTESLSRLHPKCTIVGKHFFPMNVENDCTALNSFLAEHPDINAAYIVNAGNYGICRAIHRADPEGKIRIVTNDLVEEQMDLIRSGVIAATITQEPEVQGALPLQLLFEMLAFGQEVPQKQVFTKLDIRIEGNIF